MAGTNLTGMSFDVSDTATTTETTAANAPWDANGCRMRKVVVSNDGIVSLLYRLNIGSTQHTLGAGEVVTHHIISNGFQAEAASSTCVFRAHGEG